MTASSNQPSGADRTPIPRFSPGLTLEDVRWAVSRCGVTTRDEAREFEEAFARWVGLRRAFHLSSARLGLYLVLRHLELPPGSRVLLPAWTHPSVAAAVLAAGLVPRVVDVAPGTWNMESVPGGAWEGVKAVVATHLYGCPAPVTELAAEAARHGAVLLEDCAQGLGATAGGRRVGSFGTASIFSLGVTKNLTTLGGGMLGVQDEALAGRIEEELKGLRRPRDGSILGPACKAAALILATGRPGFTYGVYPLLRWGWRWAHRDVLHGLFQERVALTPPPTARAALVQGALGMRLLPRLEEHNRRRTHNGAGLLARLQHRELPGIGLPRLPAHGGHLFMSFVLTAPHRDRLARELLERGVDTSPGYMRAVHRVPELAGRVEQAGPCPVAERLAEQQLHLPVHPALEEHHLDRIADALVESVPMVEGAAAGQGAKPLRPRDAAADPGEVRGRGGAEG